MVAGFEEGEVGSIEIGGAWAMVKRVGLKERKNMVVRGLPAPGGARRHIVMEGVGVRVSGAIPALGLAGRKPSI